MRTLLEIARTHLANWYLFIGNPDDPDQMADMLACSPITKVDQIRSRCWLSRVPTTRAWCRPNPDNLVEAFRGRGAKVEHMSETRRGTRIRQPGQRDRHVQDRRPLLAEYIR